MSMNIHLNYDLNPKWPIKFHYQYNLSYEFY